MSIYGLNQNQVDRIARSLRITETRDPSSVLFTDTLSRPVYVEVIEVISDTDGLEGKAVEKIYDLEAKAWVTNTYGFIFDEDSEESNAQTNIYSDEALTVGDIAKVEDIPDASERERWFVKKIEGGADRPIIRTASVEFPFGAIMNSIFSPVAKTEFTEEQQFVAFHPWGSTSVLPDNYTFTADKDVSGAYYTEAYPTSMYCIPLSSYPAATGFSNYRIYSGASSTSDVIFNSATGSAYKLILEDFDFANASAAAKAYYSNKVFPCSFDVAQQAFYFISPLVG